MPHIDWDDITIRQGNFCLAYIKYGGNAAKAYKKTYKCKTNNKNTLARCGWRVKKMPAVAKIIGLLQENMKEKLEITIDTQVRKLENIYIEALADKEYTPAISAVNSQSKHLGLIIEKPTATINITLAEAEKEVRSLAPEKRVLLRQIIEGQCEEVKE